MKEKTTKLNTVTSSPSSKDHHNWVRTVVTIGVFVILAAILFLLCRFFPPLPS